MPFRREQMYHLCTLQKQVPEGLATIVTWIRAEVAVPGKTLSKLRCPDTGRVLDDWKVVDAGGEPRPESWLISRSRAHRKTREASDI